ncbi:MAG TPA: aminotransferase class III-fold pyridoxal phosphate-dependent enzyme [Dehalococcoidia bacterium]|nr:aminotransferase class III-fold pyridoxal phosphate-dependent enzyme [Dehalococcoidia bacterium]
MAQRTPQERRLLDMAAQYMPGGTNGNQSFNEDLNFLVREGRGSHVWDVSGNEYVDWMMGSGPMILGHAHPAVTEAVIKAVEQGSTFFSTSEKSVLLAEELVNAIPCAEQVRFTTSGTDACFQAMRVARAYRGRDKILKFEGGYHGTSDYAQMSVTPSAREEFPNSEANNGGIPKAIQELMLIAPFNDLETTTAIIDAHHDELGGVIVEPLQRALVPQPGFLKGLREVTAHYGIPLIFDEVVTGFRLAYGGAQEFYGVVPDMCTVGKIMGGGYPCAALVGQAEFMSVYDKSSADPDSFVSQVGTLNGNPIASAAGLATLAEMRKEGAYQRLVEVGGRLCQAIKDISKQHGVPVQVCGEDSIFDIYFSDRPMINYRDTLMADSGMMTRFMTGLLERGILRGNQKFYPSIVHTDEDIDRTIQAFEEVIPGLKG